MYLVAGIFNDGYVAVLKVMETMGINIGQQCKIFADYADKQQLARAEIKSAEATKEVHITGRSNQEEIDVRVFRRSGRFMDQE